MSATPSTDNTNKAPTFHVLIAAAGKGERMKTILPKQYTKIHGKAVLRYSIDLFLSIPSCASVRVIIDAKDAELYHDATKGLNLPPPIIGGKERNESVFKGLRSIDNVKNEEIILIHDAARPCLRAHAVTSLLKTMTNAAAATLAAPITSTLRRSNETHDAQEQVTRENIWAIQTPQAFRYGDLLRAHENANTDIIHTDDTALVSAAGIPVKLVQGPSSNIKLTLPEDLEMATQLLTPSYITLSGTGFDVHAFDTTAKGPLRICGIDINHPCKLKGHSDADVALHTITDAILGAIGQGDIGQHFPPSNDDFKDMDSAFFLQKAFDLLKEQSGTLNNIDLTIICEEPKIAPHTDAMKQRLADLSGLPLQRINVKATTTEGLGFTGRKEGIAAQAIVTVTIPESAPQQ